MFVEESGVLCVRIFVSSLMVDNYLTFVLQKRVNSCVEELSAASLIDDNAIHFGFLIVIRKWMLLGDHFANV